MTALSAAAERKISKIYRYETSEDMYAGDYEELQELSYDSHGRLVSWMEVINGHNEPIYLHKLTYIDGSTIKITGFTDWDESAIDVTLENGLVKYAYLTRNSIPDESITPSYQNGLMARLIWKDEYRAGDPDSEDVTDFVITDGNPTKMISDYWSSSPIITYSDKPNKCGLVYLPFITNNTAFGFRSLAYAGLLGYGSRNLAYSVNFHPREEPDYIIRYELDDDGYVVSMVISNGSDGDGAFRFEYCDVAGVGDIPADRPVINVRGLDGNIVVEGEYTSMEVYDMCGVRCASAGLTPGIYMVVIDNRPYKVAIR